MILEFQEVIECNKLQYVKQWGNMPTSLIPQKGDVVKIHFGVNHEKERQYRVLYRIIDGENLNKITVIVKEINDGGRD